MTSISATNPDHLKRVNALLEEALELDEGARDAWLRTLPPEQQPFVPLLVSMLARAGVETDGFMKGPIGHGTLNGIDEPIDRPGAGIGPYRLVRELGAGGMATVWLAERADGILNRQVALKLPREGWAVGLAQRMARERDILAALEHPRIARLYDAGVTAEGRPWMAMEHVAGEPIDVHCRLHAPALRQRLQLFLQVAEAVAHAHGRLIVHRDLKPSNILVDDEGRATLLDFGVARLLDDDDGGQANLTALIGRAVTPDYASPEQLSGRPVTVATDVYSLGVVLYELLTGERPYRLGRAGMAGLEQALLATEVPLASESGAARRDRALAARLRGDLDAMLVKALQKEPEMRYPSVESLVADVQRHLDGEPVQAQRQTRAYRALKFARRHRVGLGAGTLVAVAILAGSGVALWQARVARVEAARAEQVKEFIASIFRKATPREGVGGKLTAEDLLDSAALRIEQELATQPRVAAELGVIVGESFSALGVPAKGGAPLRAAVSRAEQTYGPRHPMSLRGRLLLSESVNTQDVDEAERIVATAVPDALAGLPETAEMAVFALSEQSFVLAKRNHSEPSYAALRQAIEISEKHLGPQHAQTIRAIGLLANTYGRFGDRPNQMSNATEALTRARAAFGHLRPNGELVAAERWYGEALRGSQRPADAEPVLRRVLQDQRVLDAGETPRVRNAMFQLAAALEATGRVGEGLDVMRAAVALEAAQHPRDSDDRAAFLSGLAGVLTSARRVDEGLAVDARVASLDPALVRRTPAQLAAGTLRRARLLAMQGDADESARLAAGVAASDTLPALRAEAWAVSATNARLQRRSDDALAAAQRVTDDPKAVSLPFVLRAAASVELGRAWLERGDLAQAERALLEAQAHYEQAQVRHPLRMADGLVGLARVQIATGRAASARALLTPLVAEWSQVNPGSPWHGEALHWLSRAEAAAGAARDSDAHRDAAAPMLRRSRLPALEQLASR